MPMEGRDTLKAIADALNLAGVEAPSGGGRWQGITVKRILDRIECLRDTDLK